MGLVLGRDGKTRAMRAALGKSNSVYPNLYVGLLSNWDDSYDGLSLANLVHPTYGAEFTNPDFYDGRRLITFSDPSVASSTGSTATNTNSVPLEWVNNSGGTILVKGIFITDAASGTSGDVIACGSPDPGSMTVADGMSVVISAGSIVIGVD